MSRYALLSPAIQAPVQRPDGKFQDGLSYNKARMATALETVMANKPDSKKEINKFKKDDVDFIVRLLLDLQP